MLIDRPEWWDEWVDKYLPKYPLSSDEQLEQLHIKCRELACNYIEQKVIAWMYEHKVKDFKVKFEEASNVGPHLDVHLKNKRNDWYDKYWLYFDRNNWYSHIQIWVPKGNIKPLNERTSKANDSIIDELNKEIETWEIEKTVNFPFKCPWRTIT